MANTSKFTDEQVKKIKEAFINSVGKGKTIKEASESAGVDRTTIWLWRKADEEFNNQVIEIIDSRIQEVEDALFMNATSSEKAGDTAAQIFFLKNRSKGRWKDKQEFEHSGKIELSNLTDEEIDEYLNKLSEKRPTNGKAGKEKTED